MMESPFDRALDIASRQDRRLSRSAGVAFAALAIIVAAIPVQRAEARGKPRPDYAAALPVAAPDKPADGSILNLAGGYAGLVEGARARAVGDPLVIVLSEQLSTSKTAASKTAKSAAFSITPPSKGPLSILSANGLNNSGASSFSGTGNASQTSSLGGEVSVTIVELRRNGTALVRGEKQLMLSQGREWVQLSGIVRLADIDAANRIQSGQVADARITYAGSGDISRAGKQGWLTRFFNIISPF